ncbi:HAD family hydrolase [Algoriphagus namhaensis]|uniref:HAD family hydrolase n=1 Tax=Algoriphagus namhaensis TaxID=915353 RepID=A0ABV8ATC9_9BACT
MLKAVIFDMDGVISHTNPFHSVAFKEFFAKRNIYPTEEEFKLHMYGKNNGYILSHFLGRKIEGKELKKLEFEKESLFREIYRDQVADISGFIGFLSKIIQANLKVGVATSAPRANMDLILGQLGILQKFESLLAEEDVQKHKPDPEVYKESAQNLGVEPKDCLVFEDSFSGVMAAKNAGMKVVGVLSTHTIEELPPCDLYLHNYLDLDLKRIQDLF